MQMLYAITVTNMATMQYLQVIFIQINVIRIFSSGFYAQNGFLHYVIII
jgi:hypothetical protein